jgi:hypothetical protein
MLPRLHPRKINAVICSYNRRMKDYRHQQTWRDPWERASLDMVVHWNISHED